MERRTLSTVAHARLVARNIRRAYGDDGLATLVDGLERGVSNAAIGRQLGVSRERVRQWAGVLGRRVEGYIPHEDMVAMAAESSP